MAKPLKLDVLADDAAARRALKDTADGLDKVADKADEADDKLREMADGSGHLTAEMEKTEQAIKKLAAEFDATGDRSLFKQMAKHRRELGMLQKMRADLDEVTVIKVDESDGERDAQRYTSGLLDKLGEGGTKVSAKVAGILGDSVATLPPHAQAGIAAALVGGATIAAPMIGGVAASAIIGGVGAGGIAGGVAVALQDPAVTGAAGEVGERIKERLQESIGEDFAAPAIAGLTRLEEAAGNALGEIGDEMSALAPVTVELADGIGRMIENMGPGAGDALAAAVPVLRAASDEVAELGDDFGHFFSAISEDPDGAILALTAALDLLGWGVRTTGSTIRTLTVGFEALVRSGEAVTGFVSDLAEDIPLMGDGWGWANDKLRDWLGSADDAQSGGDDLSGEMRELAAAQEIATQKAMQHADKLDLLADSSQNLRLVSLDFKDGLDRLRESVQENGTTLDDNSEAGRENLRVIENLITKANQAGEAAEQRALAEGKSAEDAAKAGAKMRETYIADLEEAARQAGLSETKIQDMVKELKEADGQRARLTVEVQRVGQSFGATVASGIRASVAGMSDGGWVGGDGPAGVDSQLRMLTPREWVATEQGAEALVSAFGQQGLEQINRTGQLPLAGGGAFGGAAAGAASSGVLELVVRNVLQWPDGSVIAENITRHALNSGQSTLEAVFGLAAA